MDTSEGHNSGTPSGKFAQQQSGWLKAATGNLVHSQDFIYQRYEDFIFTQAETAVQKSLAWNLQALLGRATQINLFQTYQLNYLVFLIKLGFINTSIPDGIIPAAPDPGPGYLYIVSYNRDPTSRLLPDCEIRDVHQEYNSQATTNTVEYHNDILKVSCDNPLYAITNTTGGETYSNGKVTITTGYNTVWNCFIM